MTCTIQKNQTQLANKWHFATWSESRRTIRTYSEITSVIGAKSWANAWWRAKSTRTKRKESKSFLLLQCVIMSSAPHLWIKKRSSCWRNPVLSSGVCQGSHRWQVLMELYLKTVMMKRTRISFNKLSCTWPLSPLNHQSVMRPINGSSLISKQGSSHRPLFCRISHLWSVKNRLKVLRLLWRREDWGRRKRLASKITT